MKRNLRSSDTSCRKAVYQLLFNCYLSITYGAWMAEWLRSWLLVWCEFLPWYPPPVLRLPDNYPSLGFYGSVTYNCPCFHTLINSGFHKTAEKLMNIMINTNNSLNYRFLKTAQIIFLFLFPVYLSYSSWIQEFIPKIFIISISDKSIYLITQREIIYSWCFLKSLPSKKPESLESKYRSPDEYREGTHKNCPWQHLSHMEDLTTYFHLFFMN